MVVGSHSLQEVREVIREKTCPNIFAGCVSDGSTTKNSFLSLENSFFLSIFVSSVCLMSHQTYSDVSMLNLIIIPVKPNEIKTVA